MHVLGSQMQSVFLTVGHETRFKNTDLLECRGASVS